MNLLMPDAESGRENFFSLVRSEGSGRDSLLEILNSFESFRTYLDEEPGKLDVSRLIPDRAS